MVRGSCVNLCRVCWITIYRRSVAEGGSQVLQGTSSDVDVATFGKNGNNFEQSVIAEL